MKFVSFALAVAGVAIATPVLAQKSGNQSQPRSEEAAEDEEATEEPAKICRSIRADPNSRRKQRVCMTQEQWREFNRGQ